MTRTSKNIYACVLLSLLGTSCIGILDKEPLTEMPETIVWKDPELVKAFVNSRYNGIGHGFTESWQSSVVDETHLIWSRGCEPVTQGFISPSDLGRMNSAWNGWDNRSWAQLWKQISNCNLFFSHIDEVPFTDEAMRKRLKGEVRFIRVLMYHDLISRWGAMPIITKAYTLNDIEEIMNAKRATYEECVNFMTAELNAIIDNEELPASFSGNDQGRVTSVAALALKSRILLYAASDLMNIEVKNECIGYLSPDPKRWEKATEAAEECIKVALANGYALYDKYGEDVKTKYTQLFLECGNSEVLFDREGTASVDEENLNIIDQTNGPNGYGQWGGNTPISEFVDAFEMRDGSKFSWDNPEHKKHPYKDRDLRLAAYVLCDGDEWMGRNVEVYIDADSNGKPLSSGGRDSKYGNDNWNTSLSGYNMRKFLDETYVPNSYNTKNPKNWIWLRLGEQYLNLAESAYMTGNEPKAREALNTIRKRARMPEVTDSGESLLERIRNERRIELCFEEHRYYDLRRWKLGEKYLNKAATGVTVLRLPDGGKIYQPGQLVEQRKFIERMYWLPLLKSEVDKNPNLTQNPGYTN